MAKVAEGTGGEIVAEFQEVARHWKRMCERYWTVTSCHGCPIAEHEKAYEACSAYETDVVKMEELVMVWAAEHPEPVYPTWKEWLEEQRVVVHFDSVSEKGTKVKWELTNKSNCRIPAEIAEKLGIKPKEV